MRRRELAAGILALSLGLGGCGGLRSVHGSRATGVKPKIAFWSPALAVRRVIPDAYTCAQRIWLPLRWGALPRDTSELVLYLGSYSDPEAVPQGGADSALIAAAGIVGVSPKLHGLIVGQPPGSAFGVSEPLMPVCPPRTAGRLFIFRLFALSAGHRVTREALSAGSPLELTSEIERNAIAVGEFTATYG